MPVLDAVRAVGHGHGMAVQLVAEFGQGLDVVQRQAAHQAGHRQHGGETQRQSADDRHVFQEQEHGSPSH